MKILRPLSQTFFTFVFVLSVFGPQIADASSKRYQLPKAYPTAPHFDMTPGSLCEDSERYRYPGKVKYCKRDVDSDTKYEIIDAYDSTYGYRILITGRKNFKIDHLIPLCMGGSNEEDNLWPQHRSVYVITDPYEPELCDMLAVGRLTQDQAVEAMLKIKADPLSAKETYREIFQNRKF